MVSPGSAGENTTLRRVARHLGQPRKPPRVNVRQQNPGTHSTKDPREPLLRHHGMQDGAQGSRVPDKPRELGLDWDKDPADRRCCKGPFRLTEEEPQDSFLVGGGELGSQSLIFHPPGWGLGTRGSWGQ